MECESMYVFIGWVTNCPLLSPFLCFVLSELGRYLHFFILIYDLSPYTDTTLPYRYISIYLRGMLNKTKPTIRLVRPMKAQISLRIRVRDFADHMCLLQPASYLKNDKREPLPHRMEVQIALRLYWLHRSYCRFCCALSQIVIIVNCALWTRKSELTVCPLKIQLTLVISNSLISNNCLSRSEISGPCLNMKI